MGKKELSETFGYVVSLPSIHESTGVGLLDKMFYLGGIKSWGRKFFLLLFGCCEEKPWPNEGESYCTLSIHIQLVPHRQRRQPSL